MATGLGVTRLHDVVIVRLSSVWRPLGPRQKAWYRHVMSRPGVRAVVLDVTRPTARPLRWLQRDDLAAMAPQLVPLTDEARRWDRRVVFVFGRPIHLQRSEIPTGLRVDELTDDLGEGLLLAWAGSERTPAWRTRPLRLTDLAEDLMQRTRATEDARRRAARQLGEERPDLWSVLRRMRERELQRGPWSDPGTPPPSPHERCLLEWDHPPRMAEGRVVGGDAFDLVVVLDEPAYDLCEGTTLRLTTASELERGDDAQATAYRLDEVIQWEQHTVLALVDPERGRGDVPLGAPIRPSPPGLEAHARSATRRRGLPPVAAPEDVREAG